MPAFKLRTLSTFIFIATVGILTFLLAGIIGHYSSKEMEDEIGDSLAENAYQTSDKLESFMWTRSEEVKLLSQLNDLKNPENTTQIGKLLEQLKSSIPFYSWIGYLSTNGEVLASTGNILKGENISQRPVFQEGINGSFIGDVHEAVLLAKLLPKPKKGPLRFVDVSMPVHDDQGVKKGVLATHLSWEWANAVEQSILKPINKNKKIEIFVVSNKDKQILLGKNDVVGKTLSLKSLTEAEQGKNSWMIEKWPDGKSYVTGYLKGKGYLSYKGLGWTVLVRQPVDVAYTPIYKLKNFIMVIGLFCAALFALIAWLLADVVSRPLRKITNAAHLLRLGYQVDIPHHKGIFEIEVLTSSIKDLIASLSKTEKQLDKMESLAQHDALTGLPNRVALDDYIAEAVNAPFEQNLTFLYMDLDDFKPVNDTYGHQIGDLLLIEVAQRIQRSIRGKDFAARLGGDEFVVILNTQKENPVNEARMVAQRIINDIKLPFRFEGNEIIIGCSIGGAVWPTSDASPLKVLKLADEALYKAKRKGKNRVSFHGNKDGNVRVI